MNIALELNKVTSNRRSMLSIIFIALFWTLTSLPPAIEMDTAQAHVFIGNLAPFMSTTIGLFTILLVANELFLLEKSSGTIGTLLCTPLSLKEIWKAKSISAGIIAYVVALSSGIIMVGAVSFMQKTPIMPSLQGLVYYVLVLPLFLTGMSGIMGFMQMMLGLKENRILNMGFMIAIFAVLGLVRSVAEQRQVTGWSGLLGASATSLLVLLAGWFLVGFLNKERIITSVE